MLFINTAPLGDVTSKINNSGTPTKVETRYFIANKGKIITHNVRVPDREAKVEDVNKKNASICKLIRLNVPSLKEDGDEVILEKISSEIGSTYMASLRELTGQALVSAIKIDLPFL